jgi:hypothetical protein
MPRQERHALAAECAEQVRTRWIAKGRLQRPFLAVRQLGHVVQAAATNHTDLK